MGSAFYFSLRFEPSVAFLSAFGILTLISLCLIIFLHRKNIFWTLFSDFLRDWIPFLFTFSLAFEGGFLGAYIEAHWQTPFPNVPSNAVMVEGILINADSRPADLPDTRLWRLRLAHPVLERPLDQGMRPLERYFEISWKSKELAPELGSKIKVRALLHLPSQPTMVGGYDPQRRAWFYGLGARGRALDAPIVLEKPAKSIFKNVVYQWDNLREAVAFKTRSAFRNPEIASVAEILLCGKEGDLSQPLRNVFAASGLAHILAVAGLHLGMVTSFVGLVSYFLLSRFEWILLRFSVKRMAVFIGLIAGAGYIFFTGSHLPGVRALGVATLAMVAFQFGRTVFSLRSLAFVALGFEIVSPAIVLDAGFQMSFCAVMALGAGYRALTPATNWVRSRGWMGKNLFLPLFALAMTSMVAGSAVMPSVLARFGLLPPWFVLANLIAVPLMGLWVMPLAICSLIAMPLGIEQPFLFFMGKGIEYIIASAKFSSNLPAASIPVPIVPGWALAISIFGLSILCLGAGRKRYIGFLLFLFGMVVPSFLPKPFLLFSDSGKTSAVLEKEHLAAFSAAKAAKTKEQVFMLTSWESALGQKKGNSQFFSCDGKENCLKIFSDKKIAFVSGKDNQGAGKSEISVLCEEADLFVSFVYGVGKCQTIPALTPSMAWREGAFSVWMDQKGKFKIVSDIQKRGERPWVYPPSRIGLPNIPFAKSE